MSTLNKHITIPKNVSSNDDLDFDFLRSKGIEYIESLGSQLWTDYNTHDPGITILEVLSYAITDLGMRMDLPIENLLWDATTNSLSNQFFKASEILPVKPITDYDFRKVFIDIDPLRIKNCWLKKYSKKIYANCKESKLSYVKEDFVATPDEFIKEVELQGLYSLLVDLDETDVTLRASLKKQILEKFHEYRNLCEDLVEVTEVEEQPIAVCAKIEIESEADEEYVQAEITLALEDYLSPTITFYSLKQMLEKGYTTDEIFEGPILKNGFIDTDELLDSSLRTEVRLSDIMQLIMNIDGVKVINDISINNCILGTELLNPWNICIDADKKPTLCSKSTFSFKKGVLPVNINTAKVSEYLIELKKDRALKQADASKNKELQTPIGTQINSETYSSVTNNFPETYGIGEVGLSENATVERKAKANQLKGYLLFFDQILASYFKHLSNVKEQLSINSSLEKTYFTQAITDMEGFDDLVSDYDTGNSEALTETLFGHLDDAVKRQNQLKDHLISRFAERFGEYAFLMKTLYGSSSDAIVLQNKSDFLSNYDTISGNRAKAFNYYQQPTSNLWDTFNVTGLENRIAGLLGIKGITDTISGKKGIKRRNLSGLFAQIYDPTPGTPASNFRWRIRNSQHKIILTATDDYLTETEAANEMYFAILKIYETSEKDIFDAFENLEESSSFEDTTINTFEIIQSDSGKYSFHIINPEIEDVSSPDRIVARQYKLFNTLAEVETAITDLIKFFKEEFSDEGIFLVEHILLLPKEDEAIHETYFLPICADECLDDCCIPDPYSFRISVVLPGYTYRFADIDFRNYAEDVIRQEIPSHILGKICWIGYRKMSIHNSNNDLVDFETNFKKFLKDKTQNKQDALPDFIKSLTKLNSIYPKGRLYDCEDETEDISGKIVLGRTNLGTI